VPIRHARRVWPESSGVGSGQVLVIVAALIGWVLADRVVHGEGW